MSTQENKIKNGDLYCYATIDVSSHGFMIRTGEEFMHKIEICPLIGVELQGTSGRTTLNVSVNPESIDKMVWDERLKDGNSFIMVYRAGKTVKEVLLMIHPQLKTHLTKRKAVYETLIKNVDEMLAVLDASVVTEHICLPMKPA